ncbi:MAG: HEAT repeat domain-containing protein, partial [bacterium]
IGALLEDLQGELDNYAIEPELKRLAGSKDHKDRVDAAYYLGLVNNLATRNVLKSLINDPHPEVAEEAKDALQ